MDTAAWNERYQGSELVWGAEPNRFVREQCQRLPVGRCADLGCGEGRNALWLARLGWRVLGIDSSDAAIARARALTDKEPASVAKRLVWTVADVNTDPPGRSSVDLVVLSYLHLAAEASRQLLVSAAQALRPGGHLVLVGHDARNLEEGVGGPQDPEVLYVPASVASVLTAEGLVVQLADTVERKTEHGVALDTQVQARRPLRSAEAHPGSVSST